MPLRLRPLTFALALAGLSAQASATDLVQAYELARNSDPVIASSEALKNAQGEGVVQSRAALLPQVPTLAEAGVKGVDVYSWQAIAAPKGLPAEVKTKLATSIAGVLNEPAVKSKLTEQGFEIVANTPEQFAKFQAAEYARWKTLIEARKITAD